MPPSFHPFKIWSSFCSFSDTVKGFHTKAGGITKKWQLLLHIFHKSLQRFFFNHLSRFQFCGFVESIQQNIGDGVFKRLFSLSIFVRNKRNEEGLFVRGKKEQRSWPKGRTLFLHLIALQSPGRREMFMWAASSVASYPASRPHSGQWNKTCLSLPGLMMRLWKNTGTPTFETSHEFYLSKV